MTLFDFEMERSPCIPTPTARKIYYMSHALCGGKKSPGCLCSQLSSKYAHAALVSHTQRFSEDSSAHYLYRKSRQVPVWQFVSPEHNENIKKWTVGRL